MSNLVRSSAINFLYKIFNLLLALGIMAVTARLGTYNRGEYSILITSAQIYITIFAGFGAAAAYQISREGNFNRKYISTCLFLSGIIGSIVTFLTISISYFFKSPPLVNLWIVGLSAPFLMIIPLLSGVYLGSGNMFRMNFINSFSSSFVLITIFLLYVFRVNVTIEIILFCWALSQVISAVLSIYIYLKEHKFDGWDFKSLIPYRVYAIEIGITNIVSLLNYKIDLFLVQSFLGLSQAGVYSISISIAEMLWFISSSVTAAAYSRIGRDNKVDSGLFVIRLVHLNFLCLLLAAPMIIIGFVYTVPFLFGKAYEESLIPLLILLPGVLLFGAASTLSTYFTNQLGQPNLSRRVATFSFATNLILSLILIPNFQLIGAAFASSFAYIIAIIYGLFLFTKNSHVSWGIILHPDMAMLLQDVNKIAISIKNILRPTKRTLR
ncbi:oligosaccharide flippase family protein [Bdellovibrio sp. NC01]|uniref:oligosaccharide flippase family protein n=1 Tax=Bdellovibrio sp. NC01 TaxID=2220073 RepID=UPI00115C0277|nr:oligosaccharide flippase family protein [Bdellovibrio sp. NC01]QDK37512.1 hypothetical protein DOE51_07905 [Bdellovibrio sp. NC01]